MELAGDPESANEQLNRSAVASATIVCQAGNGDAEDEQPGPKEEKITAADIHG